MSVELKSIASLAVQHTDNMRHANKNMMTETTPGHTNQSNTPSDLMRSAFSSSQSAYLSLSENFGNAILKITEMSDKFEAQDRELSLHISENIDGKQ